VPCEI
jgi:hypothetical protein